MNDMNLLNTLSRDPVAERLAKIEGALDTIIKQATESSLEMKDAKAVALMLFDLRTEAIAAHGPSHNIPKLFLVEAGNLAAALQKYAQSGSFDESLIQPDNLMSIRLMAENCRILLK